MAELLLRDVEPTIIDRLRKRAAHHGRSVEDEHRAILRDVLFNGGDEEPSATFEAYLRQMPDVGTDEDFSRIEGSLRPTNLED